LQPISEVNLARIFVLERRGNGSRTAAQASHSGGLISSRRLRAPEWQSLLVFFPPLSAESVALGPGGPSFSH
jgi:hypothetical protein